VLGEIVAPFDAELENEEGDAECPGYGAALDEPPAISGFDEGDTRAIYEAADHQNHGVDRTDCEFGLLGTGIEPSLVQWRNRSRSGKARRRTAPRSSRNSHIPEMAVSA